MLGECVCGGGRLRTLSSFLSLTPLLNLTVATLPPATAVYMDAFLFDGAAKGIVKQAVTGAGVTFLGTADQV